MNVRLLVGCSLLGAIINFDYEPLGVENVMCKSSHAIENEEVQKEPVEKDKERIRNEQIKIFVCYHKQFPICKSDVLVPIHVGKENAQVDLGLIGDNTGDNISIKNPYFCELTAKYWIWKNVKTDIVGLYHYRRYFNFKNDHTKVHEIDQDFAVWSGNILKEIKPYFKTYDIILPKKCTFGKDKISLYGVYRRDHIQSDLDMALDIIREKYPNQYQMAYDTIHNARLGNYYNMLITKKEIFDAYAQWLFDILFELEKRTQKDVIKRDPYQQRVYGFLSELLMTVWIALHPELKIKEVPVVFVEEDRCEWTVYLFHYWARRCFNFLCRFGGEKS